MTVSTIIAVAIFLGSVLLSQRLSFNAASKLDDSIRLRIAKEFPKRSTVQTSVLFALILLSLISFHVLPQYFIELSFAYVLIFLGYLIGKLVFSVKKLRELEAPEWYVKNVVVGFGVFIGGSILSVLAFVIFGRFSGN